jgi:hypothetical protein
VSSLLYDTQRGSYSSTYTNEQNSYSTSATIMCTCGMDVRIKVGINSLRHPRKLQKNAWFYSDHPVRILGSLPLLDMRLTASAMRDKDARGCPMQAVCCMLMLPRCWSSRQGHRVPPLLQVISSRSVIGGPWLQPMRCEGVIDRTSINTRQAALGSFLFHVTFDQVSHCHAKWPSSASFWTM